MKITVALLLCFFTYSVFCAEQLPERTASFKIEYNSGHFGPDIYEISPEKIHWRLGGQYNSKDNYTIKITPKVFAKLTEALKHAIKNDVTEKLKEKENEDYIPRYEITILNIDGSKQQKTIPYELTVEVDGKPAPYKKLSTFIGEVQALCRYLVDD